MTNMRSESMLQLSSSNANTSRAILDGGNIPAPAGSHAGAIDLREIVRILRRHARIVIASTVLLVVVALLFVVLVTPLYTATSSVLIDPRRANVLDSNSQV